MHSQEYEPPKVIYSTYFDFQFMNMISVLILIIAAVFVIVILMTFLFHLLFILPVAKAATSDLESSFMLLIVPGAMA